MSWEKLKTKKFWRLYRMNEEEKTTTKQGPPQFIPKLRGKKVTIRLVLCNKSFKF
jgi:hypothetical protein